MGDEEEGLGRRGWCGRGGEVRKRLFLGELVMIFFVSRSEDVGDCEEETGGRVE